MKNYPNFRRTLAILLVLALILPCISMTAFSQDLPCQEDGCSGRYQNGICTKAGHFEAAPIEGGIYRISNAGQLYWFAELVNLGDGAGSDAVLTADIIINADMTSDDKLQWVPIGLYTSARAFVSYAGTFDGAGHTIYGLYYDNTNYDGRNAALFGTLDAEGVVKNLTLADASISGSTEIGGIVSHNHGSVIGCTQSGSVTGIGATGGIVCRNLPGAVLRDCVNTGAVSGSTTGGIAAENNGEIMACENTGAVSGSNSVGGVAGMNDGNVASSRNTASVTGSGTHVGGVVGNHTGGEIAQSGNTGSVTGASDYIGGVAGVCSGAAITESFNSGKVVGDTAKSDAVGGVAGAIDGTNTDKAVITSSYNTGSVTGRSWVGGVAGISGYQKTPMTVEIESGYTTGAVSGTSFAGALVGKLTKGTVSGTYYLQGAQNSVSGGIAATAEQFASGEIAAALNEHSNIWYQALDLEGMEPDASPVLDPAHGVVYAGYCNCTEQGYTNRENYDEPGDHVDEDWDMVCDKCGTILGEVHEHEFGEWVRTKEPTCAEPGIETRICSICNYPQTRQIERLPHTEEIIPGIPATFDEEGLTDGIRCSVCGQTVVAQVTAPLLDYNDGIIPLEVLEISCGDYETAGGASEGPAELAVDNNLNTIWHTDWYGTSRDNHWIQFEITEDYAVDGLRYKPRVTGNTNGIITEYDIQVSDDGENFRSVASGNWEGNRNWKVVEFDSENVRYVRLVALDALTDNAYVFACAAEIRLTGCKAGEAPHEHTFSEWTVTKEATCTEAGSEERTCECGEVETREIAALGHDFVNGECTRCDAVKDATFEDVEPGDFFFDPVEWAVENGITTGTSATTFDPEGVCQRASVVTFLWRAAGSPEPTITEENFVDVDADDFYYKAVLWAVENEITNGMDATHFGPYLECNRAQVVTFLWRAAGKPAHESNEHPFTDVKVDFYYDAMLWAVENGITTGMTATTFAPNATCNRAQVVTFLYRANNK